MKKLFLCIALLASMVLMGCASSKPIETVRYIQPNIDMSLFEPVKPKEDTVTQEQFKSMDLSKRFMYFGEKIIDLQSALSIANKQLSKIKELYQENDKALKVQSVPGSALYWEKSQ